MKWNALTWIVALPALVAVAPAAALDLGDAPPHASRRMTGIDGEQWSVEKTAGERGTLIMFICVHCPWVKAWNDRIAALGKQAVAAGIGVIAVNSNDPGRASQDAIEGMRGQAEAHGFAFPYVVDEGSLLARAYGAQRTPEVYLFDAVGRLAYHGTIDDNAHDADAVEERFLAKAIEAVATGSKPDPAETKALGCTIKLYPEKS
jgi:hypothetical protein